MPPRKGECWGLRLTRADKPFERTGTVRRSELFPFLFEFDCYMFSNLILLLKVERMFFFADDSEILVPPMNGIVLTVLRKEL